MDRAKILVAFHAQGLYRQGAPLIPPRVSHDGHGMGGVHAEVQDDLLDLGKVGVYHQGRILGRKIQVHRFREAVLADFQHVPDGLHDVDRGELQVLAPRQGQELPRYLCRPPGRLDGGIQVFPEGFFLRQVLLLRQQLYQVQAPHDAAEHVVEVVGDTSREGADGLHFLGLDELGLDALLFGGGTLAFANVPNDGLYVNPAAQLHGGKADVRVKCRTVGSPVHPLEVLGIALLGSPDVAEGFFDGIASIGLGCRREVHRRVPDDLPALAAEYLQGAPVAVDEDVVLHYEYRVAGVFKELLIALLALGHGDVGRFQFLLLVSQFRFKVVPVQGRVNG